MPKKITWIALMNWKRKHTYKIEIFLKKENNTTEHKMNQQPQKNELVPIIITHNNKKRNNIKMAALYDNMISASYTLKNGDLDKEKISNQSVSFTRK